VEGSGRVVMTGHVTDHLKKHGRAALEWLVEQRHWLGHASRLPLDRLLTDYDVHFSLPPLGQPLREGLLVCAVYLAALSMATGWQMDPDVRAVDVREGRIALIRAHSPASRAVRWRSGGMLRRRAS
jgi:hypothetical protein